MKRTKQARRYKQRTRRGGINFQKWAYYAALPGIIAGNAAMDYFHAKTREHKMNQRKRIKPELPAVVTIPITQESKKSKEPKEKIIVLFGHEYIEPLKHNYQVVRFDSPSKLTPPEIIENSTPSLVIYNIPINLDPVQPWEGPFIDINESTLFHYGRKSFPCYIVFDNSGSNFFKSLQNIEHLGFIFLLSNRKKTVEIINIVADVCLKRMSEDDLIAQHGRQLSGIFELKVYGLSPKYHPIFFV